MNDYQCFVDVEMFKYTLICPPYKYSLNIGFTTISLINLNKLLSSFTFLDSLTGLLCVLRDFEAFHFQNRTQPNLLFPLNSNLRQIKDLAVLQRRTAVDLPAELRITYSFCYGLPFYFYIHDVIISKRSPTNIAMANNTPISHQ